MRKLLIASNNRHKIEEFGRIFADLPFEVTYPHQEGIELDPAETGQTFEENAIIKAKAFVEATGLLTLADDSGLEVDALDGEPGVYSARYGQTAKDDHVGRYQLVLNKLAALDLPEAARTARFRCVIAVAEPGRHIELAQGAIEGYIAPRPVGQHGFGYDPIFFIPEFNRTMAQLPPEIKNKISHRGRAAQAAIPLIQALSG
jgi:XTP/dITP diphosphohydrolase